MSKTITAVDLLNDLQRSVIDSKGDAIRALALADDADLEIDIREVMDRLEDLIQYLNRKIGKFERRA